MKRDKNLIPLSHDHHHGLILSQILKEDTPPYTGLPSSLEGKKNYAIEFFNKELKKHFKEEEKILLPRCKGKDKSLDQHFDTMLTDHKELYKLFSELKKKTDKKLMDKTGRKLGEHIRFEERILFPLIQKVLNEKELELIGKELLNN